jgi:hypothetical protein
LKWGQLIKDNFFLSASIYHSDTKFKFELVGVYGPTDHTRSPGFITDLEAKVQRCTLPVVILGDFNLLCGVNDKNNTNINWTLVNLFNDDTARMALREIARTGARFTWSNKQRDPMKCVLDRALVSPEWEG